MLRRLGFFFLTNLMVIVTISLVVNLLGIRPYITAQGLDVSSLIALCLVWGMVGSFISLLLSRWMAKKMMGVQVIDPKSPGQLAGLLEKVHQIAKAAQLPAMPEVGVYESPEINAFATGPTKSRSLVAFSTGILSSMNQAELEGVIAHEIAHIKNGDMVTMTLLQGIINALVMFLARIIGYAASQAVPEERRYLVQFAVVFVLDICLSILAHLVVNYFSRIREYRADAGSAALVGRDKMIAALEHLKRRFEPIDDSKALATMKIASGGSSLWSSHPSLDSRIQALKTGV